MLGCTPAFQRPDFFVEAQGNAAWIPKIESLSGAASPWNHQIVMRQSQGLAALGPTGRRRAQE
jgi:hypothetical protein